MATYTSEWLDRFFAMFYAFQPVSATFIGVHEHDARLPDYSATGVRAMLREVDHLLTLVDSGDVDAPASDWEAVDRLLARNALLIQRWEWGESSVLLGNPCLYTGEAIFGLIALFLREYAPIDDRLAAATQRAWAIPELLAQGQRNVTRCPATWAERAIKECDGAEGFLTEGIRILQRQHDVDWDEFAIAAKHARDAFGSFRDYLRDEVMPATHERYGIGADAFDMLLQRGHCLDMDGVEVVAYARRRLDDARRLLADGAERIAPGVAPREVLERLRTLHPDVETYLATYQAEFGRARQFAIDHGLLTWPDYPITFAPIPDWARTAAPNLYFLFYRAPAPFDPHVTQQYLVTPIEPEMPAEVREQRLRDTNSSQIRMNHIIHHGGIGHHVQNWWAYRGESRIGQIAAVDCSMRIALLSGGTMAEGWACYATNLMAEQGYLSPLEELAGHDSLARMAGRAIVDASLHRREMSFEDAVAFYRDEVGMAEGASRAEVTRNSMFPGAAMMYLIGTDMIHDLRTRMGEIWGDAFSLQRFHDTFLAHGSIPVALISLFMTGEAVEMDGYIAPDRD